MDKKLSEIYDGEITHNSFLDKRTVLKCMKKSYDLAVEDILSWLSTQDYLSDNITYIVDEWKNKNQ